MGYRKRDVSQVHGQCLVSCVSPYIIPFYAPFQCKHQISGYRSSHHKDRQSWHHLWDDSKRKCHLTSIGIPIVEIRQSCDCLISTVEFPILVRLQVYMQSGPNPLQASLYWYPFTGKTASFITRTRSRRVKTLGQHHVGGNLESHVQHQLWISLS